MIYLNFRIVLFFLLAKATIALRFYVFRKKTKVMDFLCKRFCKNFYSLVEKLCNQVEEDFSFSCEGHYIELPAEVRIFGIKISYSQFRVGMGDEASEYFEYVCGELVEATHNIKLSNRNVTILNRKVLFEKRKKNLRRRRPRRMAIINV
jgi:hypothetical protein